MAYNLLGSSDFVWRGDACALRLYEQDYAGNAQSLKVIAESVGSERATSGAELLKPHLPIQFTADVVDEAGFLASRIIGASEADFKVEVDRVDAPFLVGRLLLSLPEENLYSPSPALRLKCYDGVASLKATQFLDAGHHSFADIPRLILSKLGFGIKTEIIYNWREAGQRGDISAALGQRLRVEDILSDKADRTDYDVLVAFLEAINAQLWQEGGIWRVAQRSARGSLADRVVLDAAGVVVTDDTIDRAASISDADVTLTATRPRRAATTRYVSRRPYNQAGGRFKNPRFTQPVTGEGPWEITGGGPIEQVQSTLYNRRGAKIEPGDTVRQQHPVTFREGDTIKVTFKAEGVPDAAQSNTIHQAPVLGIRAHTIADAVPKDQNHHLDAAGAWHDSSDVAHVLMPFANGDVVEPRKMEATVSSDPLPFDAQVWVQLSGPSLNVLDYYICVEAAIVGAASEQATALRAVLDLAQPGGQTYDSETTIGDAAPEVPERGAIEYQEDVTLAWKKTRDWATAQGDQSFQQLRVADRAGQQSTLLEGVELHLPARVALGFGGAILYADKRYLALYDKEPPSDVRQVVAFPHESLATDIPLEYLELTYGIGFDLPSAPRMRPETDQITGLYDRFGVLRLYPNFPFLVQRVSFRNKSGGILKSDKNYSQAGAKVDSDGAVYYEGQVNLHRNRISYIQAQVVWQQPFGIEEIPAAAFDFDADPEIRSAVVAVDEAGRAALTVLADEDTVYIRWAANKGTYPASATDPDADVSGITSAGVNSLQDLTLVSLGPGEAASCVVDAFDGYRASAEVRRKVSYQPIVDLSVYFWDESSTDITFKYSVDSSPGSLTLNIVVFDPSGYKVDQNFTGSTEGTFVIDKLETVFNSFTVLVGNQGQTITYRKYNRYVRAQP